MITRDDLLNWLKDIDASLAKEMVILAIGGTAMTLLGLKESTKDVDFCVSSEDVKELKNKAKSDKFVVDIFRDGYIFALQLPADYLEKAIDHDKKFKHIVIKILSFEDIILTKTSRLNTRDIEDIKTLIDKKKVDVNLLKTRFEEILETFAGREEEFKYHFDLVLKMIKEMK
ncbi:MAG: DUF6036 family nucleotidyltransferase [Candidatus Woesearchaeota archaeon]